MHATSLIVRRIFVFLSVLTLAALAASAQILVDNASSEPITLSGSNQFQNISVTVNPSSAFTVSVAETNVPNIQWLNACVASSCAVEGNPATIASTATATLAIQITNDLGSSGAGPFSATVTLTAGSSTATVMVTYQPGQGVTNQTPVTPASLTVGVAAGGTATNMLTLTNNTQETITINSVTGSDVWLTGTPSSTSVAAGDTDTISVVTTAGSLPNATYTGILTISFVGLPAVMVPVTFTVGAPGLTLSTVNLALSYNNGTSQSQTVTVAGVTAYSATAATTDGNNWLALTAGSQSGLVVTSVPVATPLSVLVAPAVAATLTTGNYTGTITVIDANNSANSATINVTLSITNGGATSITVYPASITFYAQTGGQTPPYQTLVVAAPTGSYAAQVTSGAPWLFAGAASGTIPANLPVSVANLSGMAAGMYTGQITITAQGLTQQVPVNLVISTNPVAQAGFPTPAGESGTVLFTSSGTTPTPASEVVSVFASDSSALTTLSVTSEPSWLTVTQSGTQLTITPNVSGLVNSVYSGAVVVTANNSAASITNSPISIPVILSTSGVSTGALTFTPSSLSFQSTNGTVSPGSATIRITAASATPFTITADSWIGYSYVADSGGGNLLTPGTLTVSVNPSGLPNGQTNGTISITAGGVTQTIPVSVTVSGNSTNSIAVSTQTLSFTASVGGAAQSQTVTLTSTGGQIPFTASVPTTLPWLSVSPTSGSTPTSVTITANPAGLTAGNYQGTVSLASAANTITITVNLAVQALPMISVSASSLSFTYISGGVTPAPQTVTVNGATGAFTAAAASDTGNWLAVTPLSGNAGSTISVSVNPAAISVGQHTGTITLTGTNGLTGQATISVALTVTPPLPDIAQVVNAASYVSGDVSPGEIITLFGTNLGPAGQTFHAQLDSSGKLATQLGGVQVLVDNFPAPMVYVSAGQVSAVVPYEVAPYGKANVWLTWQGQTSNIVTLPVAATAPGIFTLDSSGSGLAAFNADFSLNGPSNPAPKGGVVVLYLTGEGQTVPAGITGTINSTPAHNPKPAAPVSVLIGGQPATIQYAGGIEGVVEGLMQLNVQIPAGAPSGNDPVVVTIGGAVTQTGVTLAVQ